MLEVDSGSFKWKGWMPKERKNGEKVNSEKETKDLQNPEYDVVEQPFCLENVNLKIQKVDFYEILVPFYAWKAEMANVLPTLFLES